jgi:D-glycero-D-manno-heptose 1,7-bisphosphate phosphatase
MGIDQVMKRAVFLDRDGVLNRAIVRDGKPYPPTSLNELEILPGVADACRDLQSAGFLLIMTTNQPDVARGNQKKEVVESLNRAVGDSLKLDDVRVCYHDDADRCTCRKPAPGLLLQAAADWQIDLPGSFMIGDRWKDIEAGHRGGCRTVFVDHGYAESVPENFDLRVSALPDAIQWILESNKRSEENQ